MGFTLIHEHLRVRSEAVAAQWPHLYDDERELRAAIEQVRAAQARGVRTIVDPTVLGLGRDANFMGRVVDATNIQLLAATGLYTYHDLPFALANRSTRSIADLFVHDLEQGIQGTPTRAAFLKCATDAPGITPDVERVLRAVAQAHRRTGVPIMTHSYPANGSGALQQDILAAEGVDLTRVLIGHSGDTTDLDYLMRIADRGSFLGMDRYGLEDILPTAARNATVVKLCRHGYTDRLMLAQDACASIDWFDADKLKQRAPNWTMTYVPDVVIPALKAAGLTPTQINAMTVDNPRRYFERQGAY
jgi:phosphotriesterase-related protein